MGPRDSMGGAREPRLELDQLLKICEEMRDVSLYIAFTMVLRYLLFPSLRFIPPDPEAVIKERLTYDLKSHGTDGAIETVCAYMMQGLISVIVGPLGIGFCNTRSGWDVAFQDVRLIFPYSCKLSMLTR